MLKLERPLAVIDIDSTGLDPRHSHIVRLNILKVMPDGRQEFKSARMRPGEPISPGATKSHGITDEDVADARPFRAYAKSLHAYLENCDIAGFGVERFDLPLLETEFARSGIAFSLEGRAVIDAMAIFHRLEPRDLKAAHRRFAGRELPDMRVAETGVTAAYEVLLGQLKAHGSLPKSAAELSGWVHDDGNPPVDSEGRFVWSTEGDVLINFGRFRGHKLSSVVEVQPDYLQWLSANREFSDEVRRIAAIALAGKLPERK